MKDALHINLLISDIDGTLVQHRPHSNNLAHADALIPQTTIDAISRLKSAGIAIVGVTGRTFEQSKNILTKLGITGPCVFAGGATIQNLPDGEVLYEATLTDEVVEEVKGILTQYLADGRSIECNPSARDSSKYVSLWAKLRKSDTEIIKQKLDLVPDIYFVMNDGHGHKSEFGVAVLAAGTDKGSATKKLLSILNIDKSNAACIGDGANDVPMFDECGLSFAMGNASDILKSSANHVVASIENDGFAEAVDVILANKR